MRAGVWWTVAAGLAAGGVAGWASAQPASGDAITDPVWRSQATGQQMSAVYPMDAMRNEKIGVAVVRCVAAADGRLDACAVVCEGPKDWGFGAAALKATRYFRLGPEDKAGRAVVGRTVKLPFRFNPPGFKPYDKCEPVSGAAG
jgi:protein TonB